MTISEFIDALGGTSKIADFLGVGPSAVSNAKKADHLPRAWHFRLSRLAQQRGVKVEDELFERAA